MNTIDDIVSGLCLRKRLDIVSRWDDYMHFVYEEGYDGIDEMLQSHDSNKLISKLRKEYPKYVNIETDPDTASGMGELMDYSLFAYENIPAEIIKVMNF